MLADNTESRCVVHFFQGLKEQSHDPYIDIQASPETTSPL